MTIRTVMTMSFTSVIVVPQMGGSLLSPFPRVNSWLKRRTGFHKNLQLPGSLCVVTESPSRLEIAPESLRAYRCVSRSLIGGSKLRVVCSVTLESGSRGSGRDVGAFSSSAGCSVCFVSMAARGKSRTRDNWRINNQSIARIVAELRSARTTPADDSDIPLVIRAKIRTKIMPKPPSVTKATASEIAHAAPTSLAGGTTDCVGFKLAPQRLQ
jgi:hypothetical protein